MDEEGLDETIHDKIFIGRPLGINYSLLQEQLEELRDIVEKEEIKNMMDKLKSIVPNYVESLPDEVATSKINKMQFISRNRRVIL